MGIYDEFDFGLGSGSGPDRSTQPVHQTLTGGSGGAGAPASDGGFWSGMSNLGRQFANTAGDIAKQIVAQRMSDTTDDIAAKYRIGKYAQTANNPNTQQRPPPDTAKTADGRVVTLQDADVSGVTQAAAIAAAQAQAKSNAQWISGVDNKWVLLGGGLLFSAIFFRR